MIKSVLTRQGFTIIEMMVALAISAFLLIGLVQIFSSARASYQIQDATEQVQENLRFIEKFMTRELAAAGNLQRAEVERAVVESNFWPGATVPDAAFVTALEPTIVTGTGNTAEGGGTDSDSLVVTLYTNFDCTGEEVANIALKRLEFRHDVANRELDYTCQYNNVLPPTINNQPIVSNIETLQFMYGDSMASSDCTAPTPGGSAYVEMEEERELVRDSGIARYVNANDWCSPESIVAIRVGMILTSDESGALPEDTKTISLIDPNVTFPQTSRNELRKPLAFTVNLRNKSY